MLKKFFLATIVSLGIISIIIPDKNFSDNENRKLQTFPTSSIANGQFMKDMDTYLTDQFLLRDTFLSAKTTIERGLMKKCINNAFISKEQLFNRYDKDSFSQKQIDKNINAVNSFVNKYDAKVFLIPNSYEIYNEKLPFYSDNEELNHYFTGLKNVSIQDELMNSHKDEYIYYNTDHHWTTLGAYYFYQSVVDDPVKYEPEVVTDNFLGTIHSKLNMNFTPDTIHKQKTNSEIKAYYDTKKQDEGLYFNKHLNGKDKYSYFIDSNHAIVNIVNENAITDKTLVLVKDSYSNCLVPFLAENYKDIYVIDLRYFNVRVADFLKTIEADDIWVVYNKVNFLQDKNLFKLK